MEAVKKIKKIGILWNHHQRYSESEYIYPLKPDTFRLTKMNMIVIDADKIGYVNLYFYTETHLYAFA